MALYQALLFVIIQNVEVKSTFSDLGYLPVPSCPKSAREWVKSSQRLNCNDTHKYHCTPYLNEYNIYQLYELCYISFKVSKEKCLVIRGDGKLNENKCEKFLSGCPSDDYNSSDINQYPKCLGVQGDCFTEDRYCICLKETEQNTTATPQNDRSRPNGTTTKPNCTCGQNTSDPHQEVQFILVIFTSCISIPSLILNLFLCLWIRKRCTEKSRRGVETDEFTEEYIPLVDLPTGRRFDAREPDNDYSSVNSATEGVYKLTLVNYTIEDAELFKLLERQCLHKAFRGFEYLVDTRVKNKKEYIFRQHDEKGCTLLHYAAQGGSIVILEYILNIVSDDILEHTCIRGQNPLHFAIKYNKTDMAAYLINKYPALNNYNHQDNGGAFAPVHWVAWHGNQLLLKQLEDAGVDIWIQTKNELNILDIACMAKLSEESSKFCLHLLKNVSIPNLRKVDLSGWNIAHYASRSNKVDLLQLIETEENIGNNEENNESLITKKTNTSKTCLHIACEFAQNEVVGYILTKFETILNYVDDLGWNALHFAAKGGNLIILKELIKNGIDIGCLTTDGKTILHIACIHKHPKICKYAVKYLPKDLLNAKTNKNGLTAAHYLAVEKKEDGSETKILEILCESKNMDLSATCKNGFNQLEWAIDHLNIELIRGIVSAKYRRKCGVSRKSLLKAKERMKENPNQEIINILQNALKEMKK